MLNLENLKKQAKALVRLHQERSYHLACVARETLPKYEHMTDNQVLAADFKLADAQGMIARQHGCDSWAALKLRAESEPDEVEPKRRPFSGPSPYFAVPVLYVADVRRALGCYEGVLGFEVLQTSGEPPFYAEVRRGGASLALRYTHRPPIDPAVRASETMLIQAALRVADAKTLYLEFIAAGAVIDTPLQRDPFGPHFFIVEDPDGNLILFGEPGPAATAPADD
jgi:uncharacterized glyoxalase superfamily protein PhnB